MRCERRCRRHAGTGPQCAHPPGGEMFMARRGIQRAAAAVSRGQAGEPVMGCPGSDERASVPSRGYARRHGCGPDRDGPGLGHTHEHAERCARIASAHRTVARPDTLGVRAARQARGHAFSGPVACRTCHAASGVRRHGRRRHRHRAAQVTPHYRYLQRPSPDWGAQRGRVRGAWSGTVVRSVPMPQALTEGGRSVL